MECGNENKSVFSFVNVVKYISPIGFYGDVGAIIIGNQSIENMLVLSYKRLDGDLLQLQVGTYYYFIQLLTYLYFH